MSISGLRHRNPAKYPRWLAPLLVCIVLAASWRLLVVARGGGYSLWPQKPTRHALLIGIRTYQHGGSRISSAVSDLKKIQNVLVTDGGFAEENVTLLTSDGAQKPTRSNILESLKTVAASAGPNDIVFIQFTGHGLNLAEEDYLYPWDVKDSSKDLFKQTSLTKAAVQEALRGCKARLVLAVYEICRQDGSTEQPNRELRNRLERQPAKNAGPRRTLAGNELPTMISLFSCARGESSWSSADRQSGYLSYSLQRGLDGAAADANGDVTVGNLLRYCRKAVQETAREPSGHRQTPTWQVGGAAEDAMQLVVASSRPSQVGRIAVTAPLKDFRIADAYDVALRNAFALKRRGQWKAAEPGFREALRLFPQSLYARDELALIYRRERDDDPRAEALYRQMVQLAPNYPVALNGLGEIQRRRKKYREAEKLFYASMQRAGKWPVPLANLAAMYWQNDRDNPKTEELYRALVKLSPRDAGALTTLGDIERKRKNYRDAEQLYRKAMRISPKWPVPVARLATNYARVMKDYGAAKRLYRRAMQLDPKWSHPVSALAYVYYWSGDSTEEAKRLFRRAAQLDPKDSFPLMYLASLAIGEGDIATAETHYRRAVRLSPQWDIPLYTLARFVDQHKHDAVEAERLYRQLIRMKPRDPHYPLYLASFLLRQRRRPEAVASARRALAMGYKGNVPVLAETLEELGLKPKPSKR